MRTNIFGYVLSTENRKKIVKTILNYPKRQWSCTHLEEVSKLPHATVFRTIQALVDYKLLKPMKVNKRDLIYQLAEESLLRIEITRMLNIEQESAKKIARDLASKIKFKEVTAIILYGSAVKGNMNQYSDIDIMIIVKKHSETDKQIQDLAAKLSLKYNQIISALVLVKKELEGQFLNSVKENHEVLYGKTPFESG